MGPKMKKPAKNAFSFFLDDYVTSERNNGRVVSHKIAAEECGPLWVKISPEEKERYTQLAGSYKARVKGDKQNKFTNTGVSYAELERQQKDLNEKIEKADAEIKSTISNLQGESIITQLFYIIHCNYYCKTDEGLYVPGEMAIVEFNLKDGVRKTYHTLINPGSIPLGYAYEAKQTIEQVHDLPYPPYEEGDSDYFGILQKILDFLEPGKFPDGRYPPLYTIENNIKASENILQALSDNKSEGKNFFRVYLLDKLFFLLKNKCVEGRDDDTIGFPVFCNAQSEISKDVFCYVNDITCAFHVSSESKYSSCSLSVVQRNAFLICDHCCQHVEVQLVPGRHCPLNSDINPTCQNQLSNQVPKTSTISSVSLSEIGETEFDGMSSYADSFTGIGWKEEGGGVAGNFLHDELESSFSAFEISSVSSRSTGRDYSVSRSRDRKGV